MTGSDGRPELDVLGIGNAIVNILAHTEDEVLAAEGLAEGFMTLIDDGRADALYARMGPGVEVSGGSVANSTVGAASLREPRRLHREGARRRVRPGLRARHPRRRGALRDPARHGRRPPGPLPHPRHARRTPDDVNLPRGLRRAGARGHRRGPRRARGGDLPRGLPLGPAAGQGGLPGRDGRRAARRPPGGPHALGRVLRGAPPRQVPRAGQRRGQHPFRERGRAALALPGAGTSPPRSTRSAGAARSRWSRGPSTGRWSSPRRR